MSVYTFVGSTCVSVLHMKNIFFFRNLNIFINIAKRRRKTGSFLTESDSPHIEGLKKNSVSVTAVSILFNPIAGVRHFLFVLSFKGSLFGHATHDLRLSSETLSLSSSQRRTRPQRRPSTTSPRTCNCSCRSVRRCTRRSLGRSSPAGLLLFLF